MDMKKTIHNFVYCGDDRRDGVSRDVRSLLTHLTILAGRPTFKVRSSTSIASDELTVAHFSGVPVDSSDGVFSIGWNQFVGPIPQDSGRLGDASAVVFDTLATAPGWRSSHAAEDIGTVYLNYSGNHQELRKIQHFFGGTFYSLFPHLFGSASPGVSFAARYEL